MMRIYCAVLVGTAIFLSYFMGAHVGNIRCDTRIATMDAEQIIIDTKILENTNEVVLHTGVGDVRRILREKYTIAD